MTREELKSYIANCVLMGDVVKDGTDLHRYNFLASFEMEQFALSVAGSVCVDDMYFKVMDDKIVLTYCASRCPVYDLGDLVDEIGPFAFAGTPFVKVVQGGQGERLASSMIVRLAKVLKLPIKVKPRCHGGVLKIDESAFEGCKRLEWVEFLNCIEVGRWAFCGCKRLYHVSLPNRKDVGRGAFLDCERLSSAFIGKLYWGHLVKITKHKVTSREEIL